jgi:hypothetical protein
VPETLLAEYLTPASDYVSSPSRARVIQEAS